MSIQIDELTCRLLLDLHLHHSTQISITTNIRRVWRPRSITSGTPRHKTIQTFIWTITCRITKETSMDSAPAAVVKRKGNTRRGSTKRRAKSSQVKSQCDSDLWTLLTLDYISVELYDGLYSSEEEDILSNQMVVSESEDEGIYPFRRNRNCDYFKVSFAGSYQFVHEW